MRLSHVLELTLGNVEIVELQHDEYGHLEDSITIYKGYSFKALQDLTRKDLSNKVCGLYGDNNTLYICIYDAEETEQLEF